MSSDASALQDVFFLREEHQPAPPWSVQEKQPLVCEARHPRLYAPRCCLAPLGSLASPRGQSGVWADTR